MRVATPLLLVLLVVEVSDVVFAVDSIPAVFGVTLDPFIVYTSNILAILSLRGLYGFVATFMKQLRYLDKAGGCDGCGGGEGAAHGAGRDDLRAGHAHGMALLQLYSCKCAPLTLSSLPPPSAVALVLGFVGIKIVADFGGLHLPTEASLGVVASILATGVGASLLLPGGKEEEKE